MPLKKAKRAIIDALPPRWHIMFDFARAHGELPNLDNPRTFSEKIQWRKLHERDPRMPDLVDKVKAKQIVARKFGERYIIPTLAVYNSADELDFAKPPLSAPPYVLKVNHGGGGKFNIFVKETPKDPESVRRELAGFLKVDYDKILEEWIYASIDRKILVEPFIETPLGYIPDYKFHVFNGTVYAVELVIDRFKDYWISFFDRDWKRLDIKKYAKRPPYGGEVKPPVRFAEMIKLAEALAADFPYVRVDLYEISGEVKFGEMTFYPGSGYDRFEPSEWDEKFGSRWIIDAKKGEPVMPVVSIVIAAYNCRQTINRAIQSACGQTLQDIEIVVADDASTDGTYEFVQSLAAADARVKPLRLPQNGGPGAARNAAIAAATGEWIAVLDADDWYKPRRLEALLQVATDRRADFVCDNLQIYDHAREQIVDETRYGGWGGVVPLTPEGFFRGDTPLRRHAIGYIKPMVRREFLAAHGIAYNPQYRAGEDFLFLAEILLSGGKGFIMRQSYYVYVHRISPTTRKISPHSRSGAGFEFAVQGCDYLVQKYGSSMSPKALQALQYKRRVFESRILCRDMIKAVRQRKPLEAACILARRPFVLAFLSATIAKWIYANILIRGSRMKRFDGS